MERLITDIGQYGTMIEQATAALDEPIDTNTEYRDRQRQMYSDYQAAWDSQGRDSHRAFLRMINDPDQRAEFEADVADVAGNTLANCHGREANLTRPPAAICSGPALPPPSTGAGGTSGSTLHSFDSKLAPVTPSTAA